MIGVPSADWGETPVAFVTAKLRRGRSGRGRPGGDPRLGQRPRLGKMQRISAIEVVDELPRSAIGKILKRELQARYAPTA